MHSGIKLSAARLLFGAPVALYGICASAYVLLHLATGERFAVIALLNNFMPLLVLPALPLAMIVLLWRRWWLVGLLLPATLMFIVAYGPFFMPSQTRAPARASTIQKTTPLSLLTFNLHTPEANETQALIDVIVAADADVVILQELSTEAAHIFAAQLLQRYPYQALHPDAEIAILGQGVLSRFPIRENQYWEIGMGQQRVVLDVNGTRVTLYNVHVPNPFSPGRRIPRVNIQRRDVVAADILRRATAERGPLILAGDFNMTDQTAVYKSIAARYRDTYAERGFGLGPTFPGAHPYAPPLARIDYVFHSDDVQGIAAKTWSTSGGSDHHPVLVQLGIRD